MLNAHVVDLYDRVQLGSEVFVVNTLTDPRPANPGRKLVDLE